MSHPSLHDEHFLRAVTEMAERRPVVAVSDIHAEGGAKLISSGRRIDARVYDKLVRHKLVPTLEQALSVEGAMDNTRLRKEVEKLLGRQQLMRGILESALGLPMVWSIIEQIPIVRPLAFKLTVAEEERKELFHHSLVMMLISLYLAVQAERSEQEVVAAATAGLFHDIGILHIDPQLLAPGHHLSEEERRHLYAHPMISHLILEKYDEYRPTISEAVLQHHERLDGSGYPQGLRAEGLGTLPRLLAVAEVAASRIDGYSGECPRCASLELILKLNTDKFSAPLVRLLAPFYRGQASKAGSDSGLRQRRWQGLAALFAASSALPAVEKPFAPLQAFLVDQLGRLEKNLRDAGFNPNDGQWMGSEDDEQQLAEVDILADEALWQVKGVLHEVARRWPQSQVEGGLPEALADLMEAARALLEA